MLCESRWCCAQQARASAVATGKQLSAPAPAEDGLEGKRSALRDRLAQQVKQNLLGGTGGQP